MKNYMTAQLNIGEIYQSNDRLTQIAKRSTLREDFKAQQKLLSSPESSKEATLPCIMLPPTRSTSIYNRDSFTDQIDGYLFPPSGDRTFRSIVLHGIGGVGKSHVALKYAHLKTASHFLGCGAMVSQRNERQIVTELHRCRPGPRTRRGSS